MTDAQIEAATEARLRADKKLLEDGVREMANMIDDLRARNTELRELLTVVTQIHYPDRRTLREVRELARAALAKAEGK